MGIQDLADERELRKGMVTQVGEIYLDLVRLCPVKVMGERELSAGGHRYGIWLYPIRNLVTGENYHQPRLKLSPEPLNEMEVIAWVSL